MYSYAPCGCLVPEEGVRSPKTGVTDGCELLLNLEAQAVSLAGELFLQPSLLSSIYTPGPQVGGALPHQLIIKKRPSDLSPSQSDGGIVSTVVPSFQMTLIVLSSQNTSQHSFRQSLKVLSSHRGSPSKSAWAHRA